MKPLTASDCDLRDFPFMPLDVVRLRDSDLAALESAEAFRAAVLLWCASWHQIPAASLPNDDRVLANLAGFGRVVKEWVKLKNGALRGWILCDDGRLYHPVIAEKANTALDGKLRQQWYTECGRIKKHNQRHADNQLPVPEYDEFVSSRTGANCPQGQHTGVPSVSPEKQAPIERDIERDRDIENKDKKTLVRTSSARFAEFWEAWPKSPRKVGKAECEKKWKARRLDAVADLILTHLNAIKATQQWREGFEPSPLTYINQSRWVDEVIDTEGKPQKNEKPWFLSSAGIEAKGNALGVGILDGEIFPKYRERVYAAAGLTEDEYRTGKVDWEARVN